MYIAEIPNRTSPPAILLRESFRENGKVKNRTLLNLSSWPAGRIDALGRLLRGEFDYASVSEPTSGPVFSVLYALKQSAADLGIPSALGQHKPVKLRSKIEQRNERVEKSARSKPEAGLTRLKQWLTRHKIAGLVELRLGGRRIVESVNRQEPSRALELAGCYVIVTDVVQDKLSTQQVHDSYMALRKVERDFRTMKTALLELRPVFVRKQSRTRGHVFRCLLAL